jgi:pimeloyl-ACP methyl ester carboxylesterase
MILKIISPIPFIETAGAGAPILFSHANGYPPGCYQPLLSRMGQDYHIYSMLARPLWPNSYPEEIKDWQPFTSDLFAFMDQESLKSIVAIGHSLGGITSLRAVILEPQRFKALVMIDPVLFPPSYIFVRRLLWSKKMVYRLHPLINTARYRRREFTELTSVFNSFRKKSIFRYMQDDSLWAYVRGITTPTPENGFRLSFSPEWEMQIYATGIWHDMDLWRKISELTIPVLVIRGAETDTFLPQAAKLVSKRLPNARIITLEKATHLVPLEHPVEVGNIINQFLQENL